MPDDTPCRTAFITRDCPCFHGIKVLGILASSLVLKLCQIWCQREATMVEHQWRFLANYDLTDSLLVILPKLLSDLTVDSCVFMFMFGWFRQQVLVYVFSRNSSIVHRLFSRISHCNKEHKLTGFVQNIRRCLENTKLIKLTDIFRRPIASMLHLQPHVIMDLPFRTHGIQLRDGASQLVVNLGYRRLV